MKYRTFTGIMACLFIIAVVLYAFQDFYSIDQDKCQGCGTCYSVCPNDAITEEVDPSTGEYTYTIDPKKCQACAECFNSCPNDAIVGQTNIKKNYLTKSLSLGYIQSLVWDQSQKTVLLTYQVKNSSSVSIQVFNSQGKKVATLLNNHFVNSGYHTYSWYYPLAAGTFLFELSIDEKSEVKSITLH